MVIKIFFEMYIIFYDMIYFLDYYSKLYNLCFVDVNFFKIMVVVLVDFIELFCYVFIQLFLEVCIVQFYNIYVYVIIDIFYIMNFKVFFFFM